MDEQRALMDALMGKTRDATAEERKTMRRKHFSDKDICKFGLCGLCPYALFKGGSRCDIGACPYRACNDEIEMKECREEYNALSQKERERYGYEKEAIKVIEDLIRGCDRRVQTNIQRMDREASLTDEDVQKLVGLEQQIHDAYDEIENLGTNGDIDGCMARYAEIETWKKQQNLTALPRDDKRSLVCHVSGNLMSTRDNDDRVRAHFEGKLYTGWKKLRDFYSELKEKQNSNSRRDHRDKDKDRDRDRDKDRDRDRDRDKDRERGRHARSRSKDRHRSRSRDRDRDRERKRKSRSRDRSRDRDRERDKKDRKKHRDRDRDRKKSSRSDRSRSKSRSRSQSRSRRRS